MSKPTDLRIVRTRQMIKEAFLKLMDTVGFSKITVDQLAKNAFISRNTFYLHYTDKFDLLNQLENEILTGLKAIILDLPLEEMKVNGFSDKPAMVLRHVFAYVKENYTFFKLIIAENGDPAFIHKLGETIKSIIYEKNIGDSIKIPQRYMVAMVVGIQTNVISEWLRGGMQESPEQIAGFITTVLHDAPKHLLSD